MIQEQRAKAAAAAGVEAGAGSAQGGAAGDAGRAVPRGGDVSAAACGRARGTQLG